ncbi:MAG TPA: EAL domain-containing protein [Steroidobacteraceae bacterium]|nr:EAL domain-containing protein [Steroidobacteraceae bacterium]
MTRPPTEVTPPKATSFQLSIGWHLGIAFGVVAVLAIMANVIVEHGESIIKTITVSRPANVIDAQSLAVVADAEQLRAALNAITPAIRARIQLDKPETNLLVTQAQARLSQQLAAYVNPRSQDATVGKLKASITEFKNSGDDLITLTEKRKRISLEYSAHIEAMNERMKRSLDSAFKLFGRVMARQSLIRLSNQLDEIRRRFSELQTAPLDDRIAMDALIASEEAFNQSLQSNRKSLSHSEGAAWVNAMDSDFAQIVTLPAMLTDIRIQLRSAETRFNRLDLATHKLLAESQRQLLVPHNPHTSADETLSANPITTESTTEVPAIPPAEELKTQAQPSPELSGQTPTTTITTTERTHHQRTLIAWLSVMTVLLVLLLCIRTVRSVFIPVRGLLRGIEKVKAGETLPPLPRGTIKELNNLVNAFNSMSDELIAARKTMMDSQQQLELKVIERTRELQELAEHDPLTSLPNRRQLFSLLESSLADAERSKHLVGIFFLDIDNFKNINDSMDHTYGDRVLVEIAHRLRESIAAAGFAARLGGDEFIIILNNASNHHEIVAFGQRVLQSFSHAIKVDQRELMVSVSIGASIYPEHGSAPDTLLKAADAAAYHAKALGRSQLLMFTPDLLEVAANRFAIEQGLRRALHANEFELVFQPELNAETLEVDVVEALIRWRMPDGRIATPDEFLAIAEESGLIIDISDWVLHKVIETAAQWHHGPWPAARIAVNVSPRQLMDERFVGRVDVLLREFRLPPDCIEIELTENVLQTGPATLAALLRLRKLGIAIALDDFGSGYSSLASLEELPLTRIKLDRSLIASIDSNERSWAIARAIIGLCHGLGIQLTAEGIERTEQFAMLASCKAMHLQGYLFSKPLHHDEVLAALPTLSHAARQALQNIILTTTRSNVVEMTTESSRSSVKGYRT